MTKAMLRMLKKGNCHYITEKYDWLWKHNLIHLKKAKNEIVTSTECSEIVICKYETETLSRPTYRNNKKLKLSSSEDLCERKVFRRKENLDMVDSA